ncbi:hypothetical protein [Streptomyces celluloflavus]|uniref:hypothetical protein n=1 Tax=Streptomyces celluloflavus TaxID=58344 RepID=UPI0036A7D271
MSRLAHSRLDPQSLRPAAAPLSGSQDTTAIAMALTAFRALYNGHYLAYASLRLNSSHLAQQAVSETWDRLSAHWTTVLCSPCPNAVAWMTLGECVAACLTPFTSSGSAMRQPVHDAIILHQGLALSTEETGDLMGIAQADVVCLLSATQHQDPVNLSLG